MVLPPLALDGKLPRALHAKQLWHVATLYDRARHVGVVSPEGGARLASPSYAGPRRRIPHAVVPPITPLRLGELQYRLAKAVL